MKRLVTLPWSLLFGCLFAFLTIIGITGNVVVIVAVYGDRTMHKSPMNILLLNLAIADGLNLITAMVEWLPTIINGTPRWALPPILCPIARYFEIVFLFVSIETQLTVCIERYIAIVHVIHSRSLRSKRNTVAAIVLTWIFVAIFVLPYALLNKKSQNSKSCQNMLISTETWKIYKWLEFISFYAFPCVAFVVLYSKVSNKLWKTSQSFCTATSHQTILYRTDVIKTRRNVVMMLVACVSVYFICYSPIQAIFLSKALFNVNINPPYEFILLMNALAMTSSACNPLLYTLFSKRFRARIRKIFNCGHKPDNSNELFNPLSRIRPSYLEKTNVTQNFTQVVGNAAFVGKSRIINTTTKKAYVASHYGTA